MTFILAGGRGDRLRPLTDRRPKPAVPFAGRRLVDFTLLNCLHSGIRNVDVLVQYRGEELRAYLRRAWAERLGCLSVVASSDLGRPFAGTADAVRAVLACRPEADLVLVLAGDHVYRMDYRPMIEQHRVAGGSVTISVVPVPRVEARSLGVLAVGAEDVIEAFVEKPADPPTLDRHPGLSLASMGIYVFDRIALESHLHDHPEAIDFGHDVIPGMLDAGHRIVAHHFPTQGGSRYWRDIGDVDAYHGALMDLVFHDLDLGGDWPPGEQTAEPTRLLRGPGFHAPGVARDAWIGSGSIVAGGTVERSVLGRGVRVDHHAEVVESVLLDGSVVGAHARLRRVVVEAGVRIPPGAVLGYGGPQILPRVGRTRGGVTVVGRLDGLPLEETVEEHTAGAS